VQVSGKYFTFTNIADSGKLYDRLEHTLHNDGVIAVSLDLTNSVVTDDVLQCITNRFPHVERLVLCNCKITDKGLECLAALKKLKDLNLSGCRGVWNLKPLMCVKNLVYLKLCGLQIQDSDLLDLDLDSLEKLRYVDVRHCPNITEKGLRALRKAHKHLWLLPKPKNWYEKLSLQKTEAKKPHKKWRVPRLTRQQRLKWLAKRQKNESLQPQPNPCSCTMRQQS